MPRLTQVEAFPEQHRPAMRAVAAAMAASGRNPSEYTAEAYPVGETRLEVHARHHRHPDHRTRRGDLCGRCCVARYNPTTNTVSPINGIR